MREGIYRKTEAGRDEIRDRARKLPPQLRTVLLMVDGQRTLAELRQVAAGVKAPEDALERLLAEGLIEPVSNGFDAAGLAQAARGGGPGAPVPAVAEEEPPPARTADEANEYVRLYEAMSEAVRAHLGLRGYFMQLKIERCTDAAGLREVLPELRQALAKARGEEFATFWERQLQG
ncbi:hypothetical protein EIM48_08345 [Pseudoxanthomonas sp. SGNA-20]|jgi:hypothetical protein|uniref:Proline-rich protein n=1 Tax=Pseudoxanthomonas taiwanensis J19 TaxID=935569 RepID=A0A562DYY7_9GAMM|nr:MULTISPECIES: hypothetical protein [Pseudoxanthomonas]RRN56529.1 hypothetical protein EIM48_08345 [Pseudoxanthomonas sp. SGNA-20]TWH14836.1 hypothetical protein L613_002100000030 [Pseudoxanthomonas taiwanensis J19]